MWKSLLSVDPTADNLLFLSSFQETQKWYHDEQIVFQVLGNKMWWQSKSPKLPGWKQAVA